MRKHVDDVEWLSHRIGMSAIDARGHRAVDDGLADIAERLAILMESRELVAGD